jgi:methionyl-tRNA formyltransferase
LKKEHGAIDWSKSADELARFVRAMNPWPGARCSDPQGRELVVLRARAIPTSVAGPGTVLEVGQRFVVATGSGALELLELVPAGKRAMSGAEFLRGARIAVGELLAGPGAA